MAITIVLLAVNAVLLVGVLAGFLLLRARTRTLAERAAVIEARTGEFPPDLLAEIREALPPGQFFTVQFLNPLEVAALESRLGKVFGNLTPNIVRDQVYRQTVGQLRKQLAERGIVADVRLHGG